MRVIYAQLNGIAILPYIDHHDAAYAWAETRKCRLDPYTGAIQSYVLPNDPLNADAAHPAPFPKPPVSQALPQPAEGGANGKVAEARTSARPEPAPASPPNRGAGTPPSPPFAAEADDYLLDIGVPVEFLATVKNLPSFAALEDLIGQLPDEVIERLIDLADGKRPKSGRQLMLPVAVDPLRHPDTLRHVVPLPQGMDPGSFLEMPWERWQLFLHPDQRAAVESDVDGPLLIRGGAGTGKTIVALHRSLWLARRLNSGKVLLVTFTTTLRENLSRLMARLAEPVFGLARERIAVRNIDSLAMELARDLIDGPVIIEEDQLRAILASEAKNARAETYEPEFLWREWNDVIDFFGIVEEEEYLEVERRGRRTGLSAAERRTLWPIFAGVRTWMAQNGRFTFASLAQRLASELEKRGRAPFAHVVVDEAQDLGPCHLRLVRALAAPGRNDITLVGDDDQRIYRPRFSLRSAGIEVRGRTARLRVCYRTSRQIIQAADLVRRSSDSRTDREARPILPTFNGTAPVLRAMASQAEEAHVAIAWLRSLTEAGVRPQEMAVLARTKSYLADARTMVEGVSCGHGTRSDTDEARSPVARATRPATRSG